MAGQLGHAGQNGLDGISSFRVNQWIFIGYYFLHFLYVLPQGWVSFSRLQNSILPEEIKISQENKENES